MALAGEAARGGEQVACIVGSLYPVPIESDRLGWSWDTKPVQDMKVELVESRCTWILHTDVTYYQRG
jgi:hypothetical protein